MPRNTSPRFRKSLIALAVGAALAPHAAWALDLSQAPPGTVEPYVRPNIIISVDDSGSMDFCIEEKTSGADKCTKDQNGWLQVGASNRTEPVNGIWPANSRRVNVLRYALIGINGVGGVMRDTTLLPDKKIRLSWQVMHNNAGASGAGNVDSTTMKTNSMRVLDTSHRNNFISFINGIAPKNGTPSHLMFSQADSYMRQPLGTNSPWASVPGATGAPYLGCRRSYHIMMTDGRWNGTLPLFPNTDKRDNAINLTLPDKNVYGGTTAEQKAKTNLYRDNNDTKDKRGNVIFDNTLADWAFYSWAEPMQTSGMTGSMQPTADYRKAPATQSFPIKNKSPAILERYWNPRYNPATWAHMVTYTIGFSDEAVTWKKDYTNTKFNIDAPEEKVPFGYTGSFAELVTGDKTWPNMDTGGEDIRALDLWHAALNGRGRFYAVEKGEDLEKAFREIFGQINTLTDPDLTSTATSGSNTSRNDVGKFTGAYEPKNAWKGFVTAETVQKDGTTISAKGWGGKNTADKLDALPPDVTNRLILSWSDKWDATKYKGGVSFKWASDESKLSTPQKTLLGSNSTTPVSGNGEKRLNFIRGDKTLEGSETTGYPTATPFRERKSRQGDIINSVVWYTGAPASNYPLSGYAGFTRANLSRPAMLYVGGNDGMLHGFTVADGSEKIAYVPRGVISNLPLLTDPTYNNKHRYFVDGSPMTGDVDMSTQDPDASGYTADWRTLLVGTLGAGGKGYFVLDVTNPTASDTTGGISGFTEGNAQKLVKFDRTRGSNESTPSCALTGMSTTEKAVCNKAVAEDQDIGHITARPVLDEVNAMRTTQITRMNNNRWAVVLGNGYSSKNERPVLLVQYLDGEQELLRIPVTAEAAGTGKANDNGLSPPRLIDLNGDGRTDIAYAGDNLGNLWKFDLTNLSDASWGVAFGGSPLFTANGPTAIGATTRPNVQPITVAPTVRANDRMMKLGTGTSSITVPVGGMMVAFGTGRNVSSTDADSVQVQTLYSVLDNTRYRAVETTKGKRLEVHPGAGTCSPIPAANCVPAPKALGAGVIDTKLAEQKFTDLGEGSATVDAKGTENELKNDTWAKFNGWYVDMPAVGERLLKPIEFYDGSNILAMYSQVPAKGSDVDPNVESCESTSVDEERQYRTFINIMDGKRPTVQIVDAVNVVRTPVTKGPHIFITPPTITPTGEPPKAPKILDVDTKNNSEALNRMPEQSMRPSWRQLK